jgi:RimJ/RimL family protein N-acetyltransferase
MASYIIRPGRPDEIEHILKQRWGMFYEMGYTDIPALERMQAEFTPWLRTKMDTGEYLAWFATTETGEVVSGAGLWFQEWPPTVIANGPGRGYVLNVFTNTEHRGNGLARRLMEAILDYCRQNNIHTVTLHASKFGKPIYERLDFKRTNEMRLDL